MNQQISLQSALNGLPFGLSYVRESLKLRARALVHPEQTRAWLGLLNSHPVFAEMVGSNPRLINKIYRPWFSTSMDCRQRLDALAGHYRMLIDAGLGPMVARAARVPVELCRIEGKTGSLYRLQLRSVAVLEREGELVLQLMHGSELVYSAAFSLLARGAALEIGIGCMQGPQGEGGLARIKTATRELHGIRPKNLMVRLVRQLGFELGCGDLLLVGNDNRAVRSSRRKGRVFADYDALWEELGAARRADGDFSLRCEDLPALRLDEIASKKRSEAKKRQETMLLMMADIRARIAAERAKPAPSRRLPACGVPRFPLAAAWTAPAALALFEPVQAEALVAV